MFPEAFEEREVNGIMFRKKHSKKDVTYPLDKICELGLAMREKVIEERETIRKEVQRLVQINEALQVDEAEQIRKNVETIASICFRLESIERLLGEQPLLLKRMWDDESNWN